MVQPTLKSYANLALKLLRILVEKKLITPSIVENYGMKTRMRKSLLF